MPRSLLLTGLALLALALPAVAGPPWIAIESPANPLDRETRGAAFVVRVYHHATAANLRVTGRLEGLVGGERRTLDIVLKSTSRPGVYTVARQWPAEGVWTAVISVREHNNEEEATALVELDPDGEVARVRVPTRRHGDLMVPRRGGVSSSEIDRELRVRAERLARAS